MKKVILIGDSIRLGYQPFVELELVDKAHVWGPSENGRSSQNVLEHLEEWVLSRDPDIVHINCGTHDLRKERNSSVPRTPIERYIHNVETILCQIQNRTRASIIWATTTPVHEQWHLENRPTDRFEADVLAYNRAACQVCEEMGIPVNDLYALIMRAGRDNYILTDGLHFTPEGYALMGKAVSERIKNYLA